MSLRMDAALMFTSFPSYGFFLVTTSQTMMPNAKTSLWLVGSKCSWHNSGAAHFAVP